MHWDLLIYAAGAIVFFGGMGYGIYKDFKEKGK